MREVSGKIVALYLTAVRPEEQGPLLEGLPFREGTLPERIDWCDFCTLSARVESLLGGPEALVALGESILKHSDFSIYLSAFQLVASPRLIYWASNRWGGPSIFSHITNSLEDVGPEQIRVTLHIPEGYADCPQLFAVNQGLFATVPRLLGLPDAVVSLDLRERVGTYTISMPPSLTLWSRIRRAFGVIFSARMMFEELGRQQESLKRRYAELEQAHARIAQEHKHALAARDVAEEALRAKSDFLASMSHELRTPLNGVLGAAELLRDSPLSIAQQDLLEALTRSGKGLHEMVDNILDFSQLDDDAPREPAHLEPVALAALLSSSTRRCSSLATLKGLSLQITLGRGVPDVIQADPAQLSRILSIFLDNAVKFTAEGEVRLGCEASDTHLRFEIRDTGIGMAEADLARLFKPFSQADFSITRRYGGSGMGLAIADRMVRRLGGEVGVRSTPSAGSTFWFTLPLILPAPIPLPTSPSAPPAAAAAHEGPLRVLVVEDNLINQKILVGFLQKLDVSVVLASDGQEAIDVAARHPDTLDLVLMDCHMPVMDGFEASSLIRKLPRSAGELPIIAVTADVTPGVQERCRRAGMNGYIDKPITREKLVGVLDRWQARRHTA